MYFSFCKLLIINELKPIFINFHSFHSFKCTWSTRSIPYLPYNNSLFTFSAIKMAVHYTYSYSALPKVVMVRNKKFYKFRWGAGQNFRSTLNKHTTTRKLLPKRICRKPYTPKTQLIIFFGYICIRAKVFG